jgi:putative toxin-antitoxin system antitoxin component (TIGR02293 family)
MTPAISNVEKLADLQKLPQPELIEAITAGLPAELARELARRLAVTMEEMGGLLRLTPRTLQRRLEEGQLELAESERLWELTRLFFRAIEVLENEAAAVNWFKSPIQALGWATPVSFAHTAVGLRELEHILGRIEHGVFS